MLARDPCERPPKSGYKQHAGRSREIDFNEYGPVLGELVGGKAYQLYNYDIDRAWVKEEHEAYIRDTVVPAIKPLIQHQGAYVAVIGEASTTYTRKHNNELSGARSECVIEILKRELIAAGVADTSHLIHESHYGKDLALARGSKDESENDQDRRVTILPVDRDPRETESCPKPRRTRETSELRVKVACKMPGEVAINIGDESVPDEPTFRRFLWISAAEEDCMFSAADDDDAGWVIAEPMSLSLGDPDDAHSYTKLAGPATLGRQSGLLEAADGEFTVKLGGDWHPKDCGTAADAAHGYLVPFGPVECGEVPMPPRGKDCDTKDRPKLACTDADKRSAATKFGAILVRAGHDVPIDKEIEWLKRFLPEGVVHSLLDKIKIGADIAVVQIGTLDDGGPRLMRTFVFAGLQLGGPSDFDEQFAIAKETVSKTPLRLATGDPTSWTGPSDLDSDILDLPPSFASLVVPGGSTSIEELHVGGLTFAFKGINCHKSGQAIYGWFGGVSPVLCKDISDLVRYEPPDICMKEACPDGRRLAEHDRFTFKIGRASLRSLPVVGRQAADHYGCEVVAANVNIGSEGKDPIYREFVFVGRREDCDFTVAKGSAQVSFTIDRALAIGAAGDELARSDFIGRAAIRADGEIKVSPRTSVSRPFSFAMPGSFEADCHGTREISGWLLPADAVKCGEVPEPAHDTTVDDLGLDRCRDFVRHHPDVAVEVGLLRAGRYDWALDLLPEPTDPDKRYAGLYYKYPVQWLRHDLHQTIDRAVFVGRTNRGVPVVSFSDIEILDYGERNGIPWASVRFLSDPCAFDEDFDPVLVQPVDCRETLPYKGLEEIIQPRGLGMRVTGGGASGSGGTPAGGGRPTRTP